MSLNMKICNIKLIHGYYKLKVEEAGAICDYVETISSILFDIRYTYFR